MRKLRRGEKRCFKCGRLLPKEQFYKHSQMADGRLGKCKECTRVDAHDCYKGKTREQRLEYERKRNQGKQRKRNRAEYQRRSRAKNPEKSRARGRLQYAIEVGKIQRGKCEFEGSDCRGRIHAHHHDYSRALDVRWLCEYHHRKVEGRLIEE